MGLLVALILGITVVVNVVEKRSNESTNTQVENKIEVKENKAIKKKVPILEDKPTPKEPEPIKVEVQPDLKEPEPIKVEVQPDLKEPSLIKEEVKEIESSNKQNKSWLKLVLFILGPILAIIIGKHLYSKIRNNNTTKSTSEYMRREFKEDIQTDTTEQQPAQEDIQTDTTEQQPAQEEDEDTKK